MTVHKATENFILNGRKILFEDLISNKISAHTQFERDVLGFCKKWLSGDEEFIFHSSGSTGKPKDITIKRKQIIASIELTAQALRLSTNDTSLVCLPISGTGGKMMLARSLYLGMTMICKEPSANPVKNIESAASFTALTPFQLKEILKENPHKLNGYNAIIIGGAPVNDTLKDEIKKLISSPVYLTYGMTETVSHIALQLINGENPDTAFKVLPGVEIKTSKEDRLEIKGSMTNDKWVKTNDRVEILKDNSFIWKGRLDNIINSGGIKIQPEEVEVRIESVFKEININRHYFIYGIKHEALGQQCVLFIEGPTLGQEKIDALQNSLEQVVKKHHAPRKILFIPHFRYTPSGKVDKLNTVNSLL